jgi:hypothetical protein
MKRILAVGVFLILADTFYLALPCRNLVLAQSGCCKERDSYTASWRRNNLDFEACQRLNRERDNDNVFDPQGYVWWDTRCR